MRILKRPMFRKGGEVGGGITSGMRENYDVGGSARERIARVMAENPSTAIDPLSQFLIQGGLNLVAQPKTGGGALADIATAVKEPTTNLFTGLAEQGKQKREADIAAEMLDIERDTEMDLLEKKAELKVGKEFRTDQVRPAFENVVEGLTATYSESKNPALAASPDLSAFNITKFRREASPEIIARYKGVKKYSYDQKGQVVEVPTEYNPGDIIYDPITSDFLVYDNSGNTYRLDPLTFEIEE